MANVPATRSEIELLLARRLGLQLASLRAPDAPLQFKPAPQARFKRHADSPDENRKLETTRALGARLGVLAVAASHQSRQKNTSIASLSRWTAESVRASILADGATCVGLSEILDFCWSQNVPVINACLPKGFKKTDGMALSLNGKPVILTFSGRTQSSWHAFIAAHELGHHVLGHIGTDGEILDSQISRDDTDEEESAANRFAVALLTGDEDKHIGVKGRWPVAADLANRAKEFGDTRNIHAGAVLHNLCHHEPILRPLAMAALNIVDATPTAKEVYEHFNACFDLDELMDDDAEFFEKMTNISCKATSAA